VTWSTLTGAGGLVVRDGRMIHPLHQAILQRWWGTGETGVHVHANVLVNPDGTQSYDFGP